MSTLKPRHAIAFHWSNEEGTRYLQYSGIRKTYDGPVSMATDMMVWIITKDEITERMAVSMDDAWDVKGPNPGLNPDNKVPPQLTDAMKAGVWDTSDAERATVEAFKKKYGLK